MKGENVGLFMCVTVAVAVILAMTFVLTVQEAPPEYSFEFGDYEGRANTTDHTAVYVRVDVNMSDLSCSAVPTGTNCTYNFVINNTGNMDLNMTLKATVAWSGMTAWIALPDFPEIAVNSTVSFVLDARTNTTVSLILFFPSTPVPHGNYRTEISAIIEEPVQIKKHLAFWVDTDA